MSERVQEPKRMTLEEFFEWQARQDRNYELRDGVPVLPPKAMTGTSRRHDYVTTNAIIALGTRLRGGPCRPTTDDQSVVTYRGTRRPDVSVECGAYDDKAMATTEPRLVLEVWSPSNTRPDFIRKLEEYKANELIRVILIVATHTPSVTVWRRVDGAWRLEEIDGIDAIIPLPEIGTELPLAELYEGLSFED